jgi:hypothetical protein
MKEIEGVFNAQMKRINKQGILRGRNASTHFRITVRLIEAFLNLPFPRKENAEPGTQDHALTVTGITRETWEKISDGQITITRDIRVKLIALGALVGLSAGESVRNLVIAKDELNGESTHVEIRQFSGMERNYVTAQQRGLPVEPCGGGVRVLPLEQHD